MADYAMLCHWLCHALSVVVWACFHNCCMMKNCDGWLHHALSLIMPCFVSGCWNLFSWHSEVNCHDGWFSCSVMLCQWLLECVSMVTAWWKVMMADSVVVSCFVSGYWSVFLWSLDGEKPLWWVRFCSFMLPCWSVFSWSLHYVVWIICSVVVSCFASGCCCSVFSVLGLGDWNFLQMWLFDISPVLVGIVFSGPRC